jgi:hypothetical protein
VIDCVVRRSQPDPGECPTARKPLRSPSRRILVPVGAGAGPEFQDFENDERASEDDISGRRTCRPARPSPPFRKVSYSPGGRGTRRAETSRLDGSPVFPGNFGKEMARNETRFWEKPPGGPGEGTAKQMTRVRNTALLLPIHRGAIDIIGTVILIVLSFRPEFFANSKSQCRGNQPLVAGPLRRSS